ncbi:MAG: phosphate propanoyltransferase [Spirochaetales bacterium]|nr:phosphate propanoyltransferase [Spirochaetales bacterium]
MNFKLPIARSDIHIHLTSEHIETLFGKDYKLTNIKDLTIPGQFACLETVAVVGPQGRIENVVVVGPARPYTQVEISRTNGLTLGVDAPLRLSGDIAGSPGIRIIGPAGELQLSEGLIIASRHIHMHDTDARKLGIKNGEQVSVRVPGPRGLIFNEVKIKSGPNEALEMHVDLDEGHAADIIDFQEVELII